MSSRGYITYYLCILQANIVLGSNGIQYNHLYNVQAGVVYSFKRFI